MTGQPIIMVREISNTRWKEWHASTGREGTVEGHLCRRPTTHETFNYAAILPPQPPCECLLLRPQPALGVINLFPFNRNRLIYEVYFKWDASWNRQEWNGFTSARKKRDRGSNYINLDHLWFVCHYFCFSVRLNIFIRSLKTGGVSEKDS